MVTLEHVKHLAWLSRLDLSDGELVKYHREIEKVIEYLDRLESMSLSEIDPRYREKGVSEFSNDIIYDTQTKLSNIRKNLKDGYLKGPRMR